MRHLEGNASAAWRLFTAQCHRVLGLELALGLVLPLLVKGHLAINGRRRLPKTVVFIHIFGAVYSQILTQQRQIWSALGDPPSPSF